jgi:hypothetical protein
LVSGAGSAFELSLFAAVLLGAALPLFSAAEESCARDAGAPAIVQAEQTAQTANAHFHARTEFVDRRT